MRSNPPEQQREFVSLIIAHQPNLRAYIISLMPGVDGAADVLQEVNLILWEKMHIFEIGTNFRAWAFAISRFEVKAHLKRRRDSEIAMLPDMIAKKLGDQFEDEYEIDPERAEHRLAALKDCIARLSAEEQDMIDSRYSGSANFKEYATRVGKPIGTLRVNLHRIRSGLRRCIIERLRLKSFGHGSL